MTQNRFVSHLRVVVITAILAFSVYFTVRNVKFGDLVSSFQGVNYWLALSLVPIALFAHYVRAHRWKMILEHIAPHVRTSDLFAGVIVGYFMNNIIPRSGEFTRPYVTSRRDPNATYGSLFGTVVVERFIDTIGLCMITVIVLLFDETLFQGFDRLNGVDIKSFFIFWIGVLLVVILIAPTKLGFHVVEVLTKPMPTRFREKILAVFINLQKGFSALKTFKQIAVVSGETAAMYFLYWLPLYIMFFGFPGSQTSTPTMFDAMKVLALTGLATAIAPTPGAFGIYHMTAQIAMKKFLLFSNSDALAYGTINHFVGYATIMILGGYYLLAKDLSFRELLTPKQTG